MEEKRKNGAYDISHSILWFEPTINTLSFYGLEAKDLYGYGLGFGINEKIKHASTAILSAKSTTAFKQVADEFWIANYEACTSVPIMAACMR
ncbi:MAG: hypothetical protein ACTTJ7_01815 [Treponema sp.]